MNSLFRIAMLIFFIFSSSFAAGDSSNYWNVKGITSPYVLWIHKKPSYHSKQIGKIPANTRCLKKLKCSKNMSYAQYQKLSSKKKKEVKFRTKWCKVVYYGTRGWVNENFLKKATNRCP